MHNESAHLNSSASVSKLGAPASANFRSTVTPEDSDPFRAARCEPLTPRRRLAVFFQLPKSFSEAPEKTPRRWSNTYPGQADPPRDLVGDVLPVDVSDPRAGDVLHSTAAHPHLQREECRGSAVTIKELLRWRASALRGKRFRSPALIVAGPKPYNIRVLSTSCPWLGSRRRFVFFLAGNPLGLQPNGTRTSFQLLFVTFVFFLVWIFRPLQFHPTKLNRMQNCGSKVHQRSPQTGQNISEWKPLILELEPTTTGLIHSVCLGLSVLYFNTYNVPLLYLTSIFFLSMSFSERP